MELLYSTVTIVVAFIGLIDIIASVPLEADFDLQMDILTKIGVTDPWKVPSVDAKTMEIPEHLRRQFESLHRQHRVRRAYITKGIHKNPEIHGEVTYTDRNQQLFTFDISSIPEGSEVIMAELKVYKERPNHSIFKPDHAGEDGTVTDDGHHDIRTAIVSVKQLTGEEVIDMEAEPAELAAEIINQHDGVNAVVVDQREITLNSSGWKMFDVTNTIQTWVAEPESNLGLALHIDPIQAGHNAQHVADEMVFATEFNPESPNSPDSAPVLVIYTTKYAPSAEPNECQYEGEEEHRCCRRRKYVDFRDLSWTNRWVIEPAGFEAFECYGPCHNPRSRHIRELFRLPFFGSSGSSGPSTTGSGAHGHRTCGVSRSSSLPMMYLASTESGSVELKVEEIPNMIVEDCHCTL